MHEQFKPIQTSEAKEKNPISPETDVSDHILSDKTNSASAAIRASNKRTN